MREKLATKLNSLTGRIWYVIAVACIFAMQWTKCSGSFCFDCAICNRDRSVTNCASSCDDCGNCLHGYAVGPKDKRNCIRIEILKSPSEDVAMDESAEVHLPCLFNAEVQCLWTKDGQEVDISHSNRYKRSSRQSNDCSIDIRSLSDEDTGKWICTNKAHSIKTKPSHVSIILKIRVNLRSLYKVSNGQSVRKDCIFDRPVKCGWTRNRVPIIATANYEFTQGQMTTTCSLFIKSFDMSNDQGIWTCLKLGYSHGEAVASRQSRLIGCIHEAAIL